MATGPKTDSTGKIEPPDERETSLRLVVESEDFQKHLAGVLPNTMQSEEFTRLAFGALRTTPKLLDCTPESFLNALAGCAAVGLRPNTPEGFAYLIPYKIKNTDNYECTLVLGYKGLAQLMYRSNKVSVITGHAVRKGDVFEYERGLNERLQHIDTVAPSPPQGNDRQTGGNCDAAWVMVTMKDGHKAWDVMHRADIDAIRKRSPAGANGPWVTDYEQMALKTVLRRISKLMPMSAQDMAVIVADENVEAGLKQQLPSPFIEVGFEVVGHETVGPDVDDMGNCPEHDEKWVYGQAKGANVGFWSHKIGSSKDFCNPGRIARAKAEDFGMTADDLNKECKGRFNITSSGLDPKQLLEMLAWLDSPGPGADATPPLAEPPPAEEPQAAASEAPQEASNPPEAPTPEEPASETQEAGEEPAAQDKMF